LVNLAIKIINKQTFKEKTAELINKYPAYSEEFMDLYQYAMDEIEEGGSEEHECELSYNDMLEILNGNPYDSE
jgi:hypothetical protein